MNSYIDLHVHSTHSEGDYTVPELLTMAKKNNIAVFALADHNVIQGVPELLATAKQYNIQPIAGVELYTYYQEKHLHCLGYNFDPENNVLQSTLQQLQDDNYKNTKRAIDNLLKQGFVIDEQAIFKGPSSNYGIVHILKEIDAHPENMNKIEAELPPDKRDFFSKIDHYFGRNKPGHLPISELPIKKAIDMIKKSGGLAILAHPGQQLNFNDDAIIDELRAAGLDGLELISPYHSWHQVEHYQQYALQHNLIMTGGSDFHGDIDFTKKELIRRQWDYIKIPYTIWQQFKKHL